MTPDHDFNCPACLFCRTCGVSLRELEAEYRPCPGGTGLGHCHNETLPPTPSYTPEWAVPLARLWLAPEAE